MIIDNVKNIDELNAVLETVKKIFPDSSIDYDGEGKYSRKFWIEQLNKLPELLLYAKSDDKICASVFAWEDNNSITVAHCGVLEEYHRKGIGKALVLEIEKRIKNLGYDSIALGSVENVEKFYEKLGYIGSLLIQSDSHSIETLKAFNERGKNYKILWTNLYEGTISQICLKVPVADRELQKKYENTFDNCWTQMIYGKKL